MFFKKPISEIIARRYSCRTYLDQSLDPEIRRQLTFFTATNQKGPLGNRSRFGLAAASKEDTKALRGLGTYGFIKDAAGFIIGATQGGDKNLEDFGYMMEKIILYATDLGLGTCWLGGTFTRSSFAQKISLGKNEIIPAVTSVGYIAPQKRRFDQKIRQIASSDGRKPWDQLFFDGRFDNPLNRQSSGDYAVALEMVRLGPSASNRQPWRIVKDQEDWHFYLRRTPNYRDNTYAKLLGYADLQRIDMGIAMCHFELTVRDLGLEGKWKANSPEIETPNEYFEYTISWVR